jgi:hypothetical protein
VTRPIVFLRADSAHDVATCMWTGRAQQLYGSLNQRIDPDVFLQALPVPSGEPDTTVTHDYDRVRFFLTQQVDVRSLRQTYVNKIARLCETIKQHLAEPTPSVAITLWPTLPREFPSETKAIESLRNWVPLLLRRRQIPSFELTFPNADIPKHVLGHCITVGIVVELRAAILLAFQVYKSVQKVIARIQADPDTEEERVIVDIAVVGELTDVLQQKKDYTKRWLQITSPDVRERIRVLYHVA